MRLAACRSRYSPKAASPCSARERIVGAGTSNGTALVPAIPTSTSYHSPTFSNRSRAAELESPFIIYQPTGDKEGMSIAILRSIASFVRKGTLTQYLEPLRLVLPPV